MGGEFSTGEVGRFHPALTFWHLAAPKASITVLACNTALARRHLTYLARGLQEENPIPADVLPEAYPPESSPQRLSLIFFELACESRHQSKQAAEQRI